MLKWTVFALLGMFVLNHAADHDAQCPGARLILTSKALDYGNVPHILKHA